MTLERNAPPKPERGSYKRERNEAKGEILSHERKAKDAAKARDEKRCRIPSEFGPHDGPVDGAHIFKDKGMGGDHGHRTSTANLMAVCRGHHKTGVLSVHGKQIKVQPETALGADDCCSFWRRDEHGEYFLVKRELSLSPRIYERD